MERAVGRARFTGPCLGAVPDFARRQAELAAEGPDKGGIAAELQFDREIDQASAPCRRRNEQKQSAIESLILHIVRKTSIGLEQPVEAGARQSKAAAEIVSTERTGVEIGVDMLLDRRQK